jgi:hypothetical protein
MASFSSVVDRRILTRGFKSADVILVLPGDGSSIIGAGCDREQTVDYGMVPETRAARATSATPRKGCNSAFEMT